MMPRAPSKRPTPSTSKTMASLPRQKKRTYASQVASKTSTSSEATWPRQPTPPTESNWTIKTEEPGTNPIQTVAKILHSHRRYLIMRLIKLVRHTSLKSSKSSSWWLQTRETPERPRTPEQPLETTTPSLPVPPEWQISEIRGHRSAKSSMQFTKKITSIWRSRGRGAHCLIRMISSSIYRELRI